MHLILQILRLLLGWVAPSWRESVPLAVRRDGRLVNRLQPEEGPPTDSEQAPGLLSLLWRAMVRAVGCLGRRRTDRRRPEPGPRGD